MANDEQWASAMAEAESPSRHPGLWARCYAEAGGDEAKAKAEYIKARVGGAPVNASDEGVCPNCDAPCPMDAEQCTKCGAIFGQVGWKPRKKGWVGSAAEPTPQPPPAQKQTVVWPWVVVGLVGAFFAYGYSVSSTPQAMERQRQQSVIHSCWNEQKRKSLDSGSQQTIARICEGYESEYRQRHGRNP